MQKLGSQYARIRSSVRCAVGHKGSHVLVDLNRRSQCFCGFTDRKRTSLRSAFAASDSYMIMLNGTFLPLMSKVTVFYETGGLAYSEFREFKQ